MNYILSICANIDAKHISTVERNLKEMEDYISIPTEGNKGLFILILQIKVNIGINNLEQLMLKLQY